MVTTRKTAAKKAAPAAPKPQAKESAEQTWIVGPDGKRVKTEDYRA